MSRMRRNLAFIYLSSFINIFINFVSLPLVFKKTKHKQVVQVCACVCIEGGHLIGYGWSFDG